MQTNATLIKDIAGDFNAEKTMKNSPANGHENKNGYKIFLNMNCFLFTIISQYCILKFALNLVQQLEK